MPEHCVAGRHKKSRRKNVKQDQIALPVSILMMFTDLNRASKTFRFSRRRNMEFINLGSPRPVKGLNVTKIYTQDVVGMPVENGERG
ncbi:hypothetical protein H4S14_001384 [Agrobacterium vitis]|nr:hypothetical protein [Agrobacterium vitis]MBE1437646.1 hypothetical protein [Agrobacterium vitis]